MRTLFRFIFLTTILSLFGACDDDHSYADDSPKKIALSQIVGTWQLKQWNGTEITDGLYFYITLDSKEKTFEIYQNFDSAKSRHLSGTFSLTYDEDKGNFISGIYDHASGNWNHDYLIDEQLGETMTWTVTDDPSDVSIYIRCASIPEEILNGSRSVL